MIVVIREQQIIGKLNQKLKIVAHYRHQKLKGVQIILFLKWYITNLIK